MVCLLPAWFAACSGEPEVEAIPDPQGDKPAVVIGDAPADPSALAAPTRASLLEPGECMTQDDCGAGEVCVAVAPGSALCQPAEGRSVPARAPNGRPAPPIGLLDGQMMRDHAQRGGR